MNFVLFYVFFTNHLQNEILYSTINKTHKKGEYLCVIYLIKPIWIKSMAALSEKRSPAISALPHEGVKMPMELPFMPEMINCERRTTTSIYRFCGLTFWSKRARLSPRLTFLNVLSHTARIRRANTLSCAKTSSAVSIRRFPVNSATIITETVWVARSVQRSGRRSPSEIRCLRRSLLRATAALTIMANPSTPNAF